MSKKILKQIIKDMIDVLKEVQRYSVSYGNDEMTYFIQEQLNFYEKLLQYI